MRPVVSTTLEEPRPWTVAAAALGISLFYVLALDQGFLLSLIQGDLALQQNFIHELIHDARHAAAFPCH